MEYMVSVRCFTYNHSKYITDALNGFVMHETNFPFVVVVVDDASTDGEQDVIKSFVNEHFDINNVNAENRETEYAHITCAPHKSNKNCSIVVLYLKYNHYQIKKKKLPYLSEWLDNSKYHALCEGDDYWIDPLKLQKQVDFLEANLEYGMCYTRVKRYNEEKQELIDEFGGPNTTFEELISKNTVPTLTVVFRRELQQQYQVDVCPEKQNWKMGDYPMWLWFAHESKIGFLPEITGVYRILENSASHLHDLKQLSNFYNSGVDIMEFYNRKYSLGYDSKYFHRLRCRIACKVAVLHGNMMLYIQEFVRYIRTDYTALIDYKCYGYMLFFFCKKLKNRHI